MTNETPTWLALLDQLGADQIEEIRNLDYSRMSHVGLPHRADGHVVTAEEWDAHLLQTAETGALLKSVADVAFEGVPLPAGAVSVDMPVQVPGENDDGSYGGEWIRPFTGSTRDGADWTFVIKIVGYQRTDGTVERWLVTTVEDNSAPAPENPWREEEIEGVDARERAKLLVAACDEMDMLALDESFVRGGR